MKSLWKSTIQRQGTAGHNQCRRWVTSAALAVLAVGAGTLAPTFAADANQTEKPGASKPPAAQASEPTARVTGLKYNCVHVLQLEKTLKLYGQILGFQMAEAEVLHGGGIEGMLVMKMKAGDFMVCLSLPSPQHADSVSPIGNTNHNHFMLVVNDIATIGDKLKEEGYALENEAYARDKYTFFTGPNGEIIGLTEYE